MKVISDEKPNKSIQTIESTKELRLYRLNLRHGQLEIDDNISDASIDLAPIEILPKRPTQGDRIRITASNLHSLSPKSLTWELEAKDMGIQTEQDPTLLVSQTLEES